MSRIHSSRTVLTTLGACVASLHFAVAAQAPITAKNPPPRLPPTGAQGADIPAGVDTGSPTTSNAMPLGTPVPPALAPDREDQNKRSAAARAAARPVTPARAASGAAVGPTVRNGVTSRDCSAAARADAPVALPQSGFLGGSASPATASAVARGSSVRPCT